jgi:hypothetical protein
MFIEIPDLEERLSKLKAVIIKVTELCTNSDVKISFAVFEAFNVLSQTDVKLMRGLQLLKEEKSNFVATFGETSIDLAD